jgi:hypothetical protein
MTRLHVSLACVFLLALTACVFAQDTSLETAQGTVDKIGKDSLTIRPRSAEGRFEKSLTLRVTGTSKLTTVTAQKRGGKAVIVQRDVSDIRELRPKQGVAVIYTNGASGPVLLAAVVLPTGDR